LPEVSEMKHCLRRASVALAICLAMSLGCRQPPQDATLEIGRRNDCISNLKQIDGAKEAAISQRGLTNGEVVPTSLLIPSLYPHRLPQCPSGGTYEVNAAGQEPTCSISGHALVGGGDIPEEVVEQVGPIVIERHP
jgi:hypothetical protein